jgi:hypothetical protein
MKGLGGSKTRRVGSLETYAFFGGTALVFYFIFNVNPNNDNNQSLIKAKLNHSFTDARKRTL